MAIELTNEEAQSFLVFRKHQQDIEQIIKAGVFNLRNGSAVLFFDFYGNLAEIRVNFVPFKQNKKVYLTYTRRVWDNVNEVPQKVLGHPNHVKPK